MKTFLLKKLWILLIGKIVNKYKIEFNRAYIKELKKIPARDQQKILDLAKEPKPDGCKKLQGKKSPPLYRIRCGDYRVVYSLREKILLILIIKIGHRKNIYEMLE